MAYRPLTDIPQQFFDSSGNPLSGGTLYAYLAGTSTPTNLYSDNSGTVAGTSVTLDARGEPTTIKLIWLDTTKIYKLVLKDANDATIWTVDNINGDDGSTGSSASSVFDQQTITATGGQTLFNLGFEYVTGTNAMAVYKNGARLVKDIDFTETSSTSVTLTQAAIADDEYTFIGGQDVGSSFSSSNVSFIQSGTGAVTRSVQTKLREFVSVKDFGAVGDGVTSDLTAIQNAIAVGGHIVFPTATYLGGVITILGDNIVIDGRGSTLLNSRIVISSTSSNVTIRDLRVLDNTSDANSYLFDISGERFTLDNVTFEKDPGAGGYQGYIRRTSSFGVFNGVRLYGSNGIYISGHDHTFQGCELVADSGGDDAYVLKAGDSANNSYQTYNISIKGGTVTGYAAIVSIGSEVGNYATAGSYANYVRNVSVDGVVGYNCARIAYFKPGGLNSDYRNGLVEVVNVSNCTLLDTQGTEFTRAFELIAGRGCIMRDIIINNCVVRARAYTDAVRNAGVYIQVKNFGDAATIQNVSINDVTIVDVHDGVDNSVSYPGYPIDYGSFCELENTSLGTISGVTFNNFNVFGNRFGGMYFGASLSNVRVNRPVLINVANNPPSSLSAGGIWSASNISISGAEITADNHYAIGGTTLTAVQYTAEADTVYIGSISAGNSGQGSCWVAPRNAYVWKIEVVNNGAISQSNTDYTTLEFRNMGTGNVLVSATTQTTGGINIPDDSPPTSLSTTTLVGANSVFPKGTVLRWAKSDTGSGRAITNMYAIVHYVTY